MNVFLLRFPFSCISVHRLQTFSSNMAFPLSLKSDETSPGQVALSVQWTFLHRIYPLTFPPFLSPFQLASSPTHFSHTPSRFCCSVSSAPQVFVTHREDEHSKPISSFLFTLFLFRFCLALLAMSTLRFFPTVFVLVFYKLSPNNVFVVCLGILLTFSKSEIDKTLPVVIFSN